MKHKTNSVIQDANVIPDNAYVTWSDDNIEDKRRALGEISKSIDDFAGIERSAAGLWGYSYKDLAAGPTSGRPGLTRLGYDYFRPEEAVPTKTKEIMAYADSIYQKVGLVKNVIDLMGDFASQGIRIVHPNKKVERFYQNWFKKVNGQDRSERFLNLLYRNGNVVINKQTARISKKTENQLYKVGANKQMDAIVNEALTQTPITEKREIPWKYTFIDPIFVDVVGGPVASFVGTKSYTIVIPQSLRKIIASPKNDAERAIVSQLPEDIILASNQKKPYILDPNKIAVYHYKKDDWRIWAYPIIYSIMDDIQIVEKLKLADLAALDGAISNIRIFKLGSLDHKIAPTSGAASKLSSILQNNVGGGTMDLVWGPDIELVESKTSVHQFLGEEKYKPHLNSIYAGLGIPPTLTGTFGAAGTTNNFISLKTLTQRLEYGRKVLSSFWEEEIVRVQKAMGFRLPAKIEFDTMDISNEDSEKALLIQLADRNIISDEILQKSFGFDPEMEKARLKRETRERASNKMPKKSGPYYDPQFINTLKRTALQTGLATPSQVGLNLSPRADGEMTTIEMKAPKPNNRVEENNPTGVSGQGRPRNSRDTVDRKERTFKPQTGASINLWAMETQEKISEILNPYFLEFYDKKNMRSLSSYEYNESDIVKTKILLSLEPFESIDSEKVLSKLNTINSIDCIRKYSEYTNVAKQTANQINRQLTTEELKYTKAYVYESYWCND